jgi:hypothetical protein
VLTSQIPKKQKHHWGSRAVSTDCFLFSLYSCPKRTEGPPILWAELPSCVRAQAAMQKVPWDYGAAFEPRAGGLAYRWITCPGKCCSSNTVRAPILTASMAAKVMKWEKSGRGIYRVPVCGFHGCQYDTNQRAGPGIWKHLQVVFGDVQIIEGFEGVQEMGGEFC